MISQLITQIVALACFYGSLNIERKIQQIIHPEIYTRIQAPLNITPNENNKSSDPQTIITFLEAIIVFMTSAILLLLVYYRRKIGKEKSLRSKHEQIMSQDFHIQLVQYEMAAFKAQLNPHFIFNCLNSVNRFILQSEPEIASVYLTKFSKLIRKILENSNGMNVPLLNEIEAVSLYLEMETVRFEDRFSYSFHVQPSINLGKLFVPPMIIQPYVENAIWHGILMRTTPGKVLITVSKTKEHVVYVIEDNGIGRKASEKARRNYPETTRLLGTGLTSARLKLLTDNGASSVITEDLYTREGEPRGTKVTVLIPIRTSPQDPYATKRF